MSTYSNINNSIYNQTGGKFGIRTNGDSEDGVILTLSENVGNYCLQPLKDENNTIYENQKRIQKIEAVASIVIADYATNRQRNMYDNLMNDQNANAILSSLGYGNHTAQTAETNLLSNGFIGSVSGGHTSNTHSAKADSLTSAERTALMITGQFTRTVDGDRVVFKVNGADSNTVTKTLRATDAENEKNNKVLNAKTAKDQVAAMKELRNASISNLRTSGIDIGRGTSRDIRRARNELQNKLNNALSNGNQTAANQIQNQINKLNQHESRFGGSDSAHGSRQNNRRMGLTTIARGVMGNDLYTGYTQFKRAAVVTTVSVRMAGRAANGAIYNVEKMLAHFNPNGRISQLKDAHGRAIQRSKDRTNARRNGNIKEFRQGERERRTKNRDARREKRDKRFEASQTRLKNQGSTTKANKRARRRDHKKERMGRLTNIRKNISKRFTAVTDAFKSLSRLITNNPLMKLIKFPGTVIGTIKDWLKKFIMKPILIGAGIFLGFFLVISGIIDIMLYAVHFLSEEIQTNYVDTLNSINYNQLIIDDVSETLGKGFLEVAKKDAERHYLDIDNEDGSGSGAVRSDGLDWYKTPTDGELRHIYSSEDQKELGGVNANLLPIHSVMHFRFKEDIDFLEWLTAKGYDYYLYVATHNILGYDYEDADDCAKDALYSGTVTWDVETRTLIRPHDELCSNLYIHGYDTNLNRTLNKAKVAISDGLNLALNLLELPYTFNTSAYGIFDEIPSDSVDTCDNSLPVQAGTREGTDISSPDVDNDCGYIYHIHTANCYKQTCKKLIHSHDDGTCDYSGCNHTHNDKCCSKENHPACSYATCGQYSGSVCPLWHDHSRNCDTSNCTHTHDHNCCSKELHTHLSGPSANYTSDKDFDYNECWELICGTPAHVHKPWVNDITSGCWKTKYICLGHCGGHIIPQIDVELDMTYKNIISYDNYKATYWLSDSDFKQSWITENLKMNNIVEWKTAWDKKMAGWFIPFPNSSQDIIEKYGKDIIWSLANASDNITSWISGLVTGCSENDIQTNVKENQDDDVSSFEGWCTEDGTLDESIIEELRDMYGTYETDYEEGVSAWEDFDVVFPTGFSRPMTQSQINNTLEQIKNTYPNLSESRIQVITQAMDYVGDFWYDLSTKTGNANSTNGRIDCSGFVSSVLNHGIGWSNDWTASGFASAGYNYGGIPSSLTPGDIVAMNTTSSWSGSGGWGNGGTNHVVIYVGFLPEGVKGYPGCNEPGNYIIDCSSRVGGSAIRKLEDKTFSKYPYVYNGCY